MLVSLLIISSVLVVSDAQPIKAQSSNAIYIRQDGSVDPSTAPIQRSGDIYTLTGNIAGNITVQKYNIVIDGAGYTLQGPGVAGEGQPMRSIGINLRYEYDATIRNIRIRDFDQGIYIGNSFGTIICAYMNYSGYVCKKIVILFWCYISHANLYITNYNKSRRIINPV